MPAIPGVEKFGVMGHHSRDSLLGQKTEQPIDVHTVSVDAMQMHHIGLAAANEADEPPGGPCVAAIHERSGAIGYLMRCSLRLGAEFERLLLPSRGARRLLAAVAHHAAEALRLQPRIYVGRNLARAPLPEYYINLNNRHPS